MDGRNLLSPIVVFPALWLLGVVLAQIHVVALQRPWSWRMWVVAFLVRAVFFCTGVPWRRNSSRVRGHAKSAAAWLGRFRGQLPLRPILVLFIVVGYIELAHQFSAAGQAAAVFVEHRRRTSPRFPAGSLIVSSTPTC